MNYDQMMKDIVDTYFEFSFGKAIAALILGSASICIYYFLTTLIIGTMDLSAADNAVEVMALFETLNGYYYSKIHWAIGGTIFVLIAYRTPWLVLFIAGIGELVTSFIAFMFFYHVVLYYSIPVIIWFVMELIIAALKETDL